MPRKSQPKRSKKKRRKAKVRRRRGCESLLSGVPQTHIVYVNCSEDDITDLTDFQTSKVTVIPHDSDQWFLNSYHDRDVEKGLTTSSELNGDSGGGGVGERKGKEEDDDAYKTKSNYATAVDDDDIEDSADKMDKYRHKNNWRKVWLRRAKNDWPVVILTGILMVIMETVLTPHKQCIPGLDGINSRCGTEADMSLSKPLKEEQTISTYLLIVLMTLIPCLIFGVHFVYLHYYYHSANSSLNLVLNWRISAMQFERMVRVTSFGTVVSSIMTLFLKLYVGSPRPNFYAGNGKSKYQHEVRLSFPSGHSSNIWIICMLMTLWLLDALHLAQTICTSPSRALRRKLQRKQKNEQFLAFFGLDLFVNCVDYSAFCIVLICVPLFIALYISASRIVDFWHHAVDVTAGAVIGIASAFFVRSVYANELSTPITQLSDH